MISNDNKESIGSLSSWRKSLTYYNNMYKKKKTFSNNYLNNKIIYIYQYY